ncbi:hypothetical protein ABT093_17070 [Kitasatospora sp. NPDC002551]|uniref:NHL domain-containing protein n=1 Tax=Kitasatospora sp. NPDC002551 TaxID=3154539 RepID=UPI00332EE0C5
MGIITTVAGCLEFTDGKGDGGPATQADLTFPSAVAVDTHGNLYIADTGRSRIRKVSAGDGIITTIAGNRHAGSGGDGPATRPPLYEPQGVAVDAHGNLYISDTEHHRVRKVSASDGTITTVAGTGERGFGGDGGPATRARLQAPEALCVDAQGNLFIASDSRVRRVSAVDQTITTVVGTGRAEGGGDGGPARLTAIYTPNGLAVDAEGNLYLADGMLEAVRRVSASDQTITTIAGRGFRLYSGDGGPAREAYFDRPEGVALDSRGNLYIADSHNYRVRMVSAGDGTITTVAGDGKQGTGGDGGPAIKARLALPNAVAVDAQDNLYILDSGTVRKVTFTAPKPAPAPAPTVPKTRANLSGQASCDNQRTTPAAAFKKRLTVTARSTDDGSLLAGIPVLFTVSGGTGSHFPDGAATAEAVTDAQGTAKAPQLTAGPTPGTVTISVEAHRNPGSNPARYRAQVTPA